MAPNPQEWLASLDSSEAASVRALIEQAPSTRRLLAAIAEGSPFLWSLIAADSRRFVAILSSDSDERLAKLLADTTHAVTSAADEATAMQALRRMKAEAALLIALSDIGGVWSLQQVTDALTRLADTAVGSATDFLLRAAAKSGKLRLPDPEHPSVGSGYVVLAMGKMGAFELNYSSDIDLIVLFDRHAPAVVDPDTATGTFVRITQGLVRLLQQRTGDGYVFRTDLRLRPDPASTAIAVSVDSALEYYGSVGLNWERAAMIKARPCAGDLAAGEGVLRQLSPFIWRKYLDYAAIADVEAMKRQIHAFKGHEALAVEGHNIKLGRGGIREIEFFVQTQQLIAGGRHPELRGRQTLDVLDALVAGRWVSAAARDDLRAAYEFLRRIEHRLQMVADEQTHTLPIEREAFERFARFAGYANRDDLASELLHHMRRVQQHYSQLFQERGDAGHAPALLFPRERDAAETLSRLADLGFRAPGEASARIRRWLSGSVPTIRSEIAQNHLRDLIPLLILRLSQTSDPDVALLAFDRFIGSLRHPVHLFSMLRQHPDLISLIALILGAAPRLADIVARQPDTVDALLEPSFFGALPSREMLEGDLARRLGDAPSQEETFDRLRMFAQEHMLLIGARILSGTASAAQAGVAFATVADCALRAVMASVEETFVAAHGRIAGQRLALVAMGKLGGQEMAATSDLDLILIYEFDDEEPQSDGARPLYGAQYFARLTQRLISALSAQTNYGALYQVDMRLRPSGRAGPLATRLRAFRSYQRDDAWTWEHMALTRARIVSGDPNFISEVENTIREVLRRPRDRTAMAVDVVAMRHAIAQERSEEQRWNLKYAAGGLIDVEFIAQYLQLVHAAAHPEILDTSTIGTFERALRLGLLPADEAEMLRPAAKLLHDLTQVLRLCLAGDFQPKSAGADLLALLARAGDMPDFTTLEAHLAETQRRVRESFERILSPADRGSSEVAQPR